MSVENSPTPIFDRMLRFHGEGNEEAFEKERRLLIDEMIQGAPEEHREKLFVTQHRIDMSFLKDSLQFEDLKELYGKDHEAFERERRRILNFGIESESPERRPRLTGIQFQIDTELGRQRYNNPIARFNRIVEIFWKGVFKLHAALKGCVPDENAHSPAGVLTFHARGKE